MTDRDDDLNISAIARCWDVPKLNDAAGVTPQFQRSFVAVRIAQVLAEITYGDDFHQLSLTDRTWLKLKAELMIESALAHHAKLMQQLAERAAEDHDANPEPRP